MDRVLEIRKPGSTKLKQSAIDEEQYNKVFSRPFATPSLPTSKSETDVQTSHLDVNFDEKDYSRHRKSSAKYHEPLRRIHTSHKDLAALAKKESRKHKKHKHKHEHKEGQHKGSHRSSHRSEKQGQNDKNLPGIEESHQESIYTDQEGGRKELPSVTDSEDDRGLELVIGSKRDRKGAEQELESVADIGLKDGESDQSKSVNGKETALPVEMDIEDGGQKQKSSAPDEKVTSQDQLIPAQDSKTLPQPTSDIKTQTETKTQPEIIAKSEIIAKPKTVETAQESEKIDGTVKTPETARKQKVAVEVFLGDEKIKVLSDSNAEINILVPKEKAEHALVEVLPPIDEGINDNILRDDELDSAGKDALLISHHTDRLVAPMQHLGDRREGKRRHHRRHHHSHSQKHRTISEREAIANKARIRSGALTLSETGPAFVDLALKVPSENEEKLENRDLEEMAWHRFEDFPGLRRRRPQFRKIKLKSGMLTRRRGSTCSDITASLHKFPVQYDHSPHEAFIELQELTGKDQDMRWKETARWIKFEEDVEDSNRWGKPHVASLSFHSLLELRKGLERGTVLLDLEQFDLQSIAEAIVDNMVITDQLCKEDSDRVLSALLVKHKHQYQEAGNLPRRPSFYNLKTFTPNLSRRNNEEDKNSVKMVVTEKVPVDEETDMIRLKIDDNIDVGSHTVSIDGSESALINTIDTNKKDEKLEVTFGPTTTTQPQDPLKNQESDVKARVPEDAEATNVLVGTLDCLKNPVTAFVRLATGCYLGNVTEVAIPVRFLFVMLGPETQSDTYHEIGRSIATLMSDQVFHDLAYYSESREDILMAINEFLDDTVVLPPGEWDKQLLIPVLLSQSKTMAKRRKQAKEINAIATQAAEEEDNPLKRTGRFCGGLIQDIKHRSKTYISDFKDGFNWQCLLVTVFLYFAVFAPNVAFGGLLAEKTDQWLGVSEVIFASCFCGLLFALFSGQPLIIIGATGPVMVFEQTIFKFCEQSNIEFLPWRCWIGFWVLVILFLVVAFEGCFLVRYFTRFTEELFACLISLIFIYEAINFLYKVFKKNPLSRDPVTNLTNIDPYIKENIVPVTGEPNTALLCAILMFGTYFVAFYMRKFRNSHFFGKKARRLVSDFGIAIAMITMVIIDVAIRDTVITPKISIGDVTKVGFHPTLKTKRGWFINPMGLVDSMKAGWVFAAIIPALFVGILLFMETELTGVLINKKENCLQKRPGYNMDLLLMGVITLICSLFGLPWMCPATVRSVSHFNALSVWSTSHAPGEKPYLVEVREQRITNILIHVLTGMSILLAPVLHHVPVPVLFGVLLYLGLSSLSNLQLINRLIMMLMPPKHHPDVRYVRKVPTAKIHGYTLIQLACLLVLMAVKLTILAPSFPFFIICLIPVRRLLGKVFSQHDLEELDNEEDDYDDSDIDEYDTLIMPI
ncbi:band 3 anion transport protein isoform X2 [Nematostella vectensis]|uniref:band 3 anion transport protein isoform X2 n=1 Tax=Nematostella vectensis TaxID=45351 RepID=UPI002077811B|nr:band 3 anion transport protein isoform X2 [Nematostella vectensis]